MDELTEWTTAQMQEEFTVVGFALGVCVVKRKSDGVTGTLDFERRGDKRVYYGWQEA
jgi:hypothetical protein